MGNSTSVAVPVVHAAPGPQQPRAVTAPPYRRVLARVWGWVLGAARRSQICESAMALGLTRALMPTPAKTSNGSRACSLAQRDPRPPASTIAAPCVPGGWRAYFARPGWVRYMRGQAAGRRPCGAAQSDGSIGFIEGSTFSFVCMSIAMCPHVDVVGPRSSAFTGSQLSRQQFPSQLGTWGLCGDTHAGLSVLCFYRGSNPGGPAARQPPVACALPARCASRTPCLVII